MKRLFTALLATTIFAGAAHATGPKELVEQLSNNLISEVKANPALKNDPNALRNLVNEKAAPHFDFDEMSKRVLARNWRAASANQKARFSKAFQGLLIKSYSTILTEYKDATITFEPFRGADGDRATVTAEVETNAGLPVPLEFSLRDAGGAWKIYDVKADSISVMSSFRREYARVIDKKGIDGLIKDIEAKVGQ